MHGGSDTGTYTAVCRPDSQRGFPADSAQTRARKQPRGVGCGGRQEGAQASGTPWANLGLLHAAVWCKPMQFCKAIILPN